MVWANGGPVKNLQSMKWNIQAEKDSIELDSAKIEKINITIQTHLDGFSVYSSRNTQKFCNLRQICNTEIRRCLKNVSFINLAENILKNINRKSQIK